MTRGESGILLASMAWRHASGAQHHRVSYQNGAAHAWRGIAVHQTHISGKESSGGGENLLMRENMAELRSVKAKGGISATPHISSAIRRRNQ